MNESAVTAVIVNYRTPELAMRCINALFSAPVAAVRLTAVLVDGHSDDGSADKLREFCANHPSSSVGFLPQSQNGGFGWANNQALLRELGRPDPPDFVYLLNPDAFVESDALARLLALMHAKPCCGAAGSLLVDDDGRKLGSAFCFPSLRSEFIRGTKTAWLGNILGVGDGVIMSDAAIEVDWVTGASVLVRSGALVKAGVFDDGFFLYFEDVELMRRLRTAGWSVWHEPASKVVHVGGAATGLTSRRGSGSRLPRRPAYWYKSRRRYFVLAHGRSIATLATLSWLTGAIVWKARALLRLGGQHQEVMSELIDTSRYGVFGRAVDARAAVPSNVSQIGTAPAWMSDGDE